MLAALDRDTQLLVHKLPERGVSGGHELVLAGELLCISSQGMGM